MARVQYFGWWADESDDHYSKIEALRILKTVPERCIEEDCRNKEVLDALTSLERFSIRTAPIYNFRKALDIENPLDRYEKVKMAFQAIVRGL